MKSTLNSLHDWVKQYHTVGVSWNSNKGGGAAASAAASTAAAAGGGGGSASASNEAFQTDVIPTANRIVELGTAIGADLAAAAQSYRGAFEEVGKFLVAAAKQPKPADLTGMLAGIVGKQNELKEHNKNRKSVNPVHIQALMEGSGACTWVTVSPAPCPFIKSAGLEAADFYLNKVLKVCSLVFACTPVFFFHSFSLLLPLLGRRRRARRAAKSMLSGCRQ